MFVLKRTSFILVLGLFLLSISTAQMPKFKINSIQVKGNVRADSTIILLNSGLSVGEEIVSDREVCRLEAISAGTKGNDVTENLRVVQSHEALGQYGAEPDGVLLVLLESQKIGPVVIARVHVEHAADELEPQRGRHLVQKVDGHAGQGGEL